MGEIEEIAEIAESIIEDLIEFATEKELPEEIVSSLTEIETTIQNDLITAVNDEGLSVTDALTSSYNKLYAINEDLAEQFATEMSEQGKIPFSPSPDEAQIEDFEDISPESDPDKGDVNTIACQENPELPECVVQQGTRISRFIDTLIKVVPIIVPAIAVFVYFFGWIAIKVCELWQRITGQCTPPGSPPSSPGSPGCDQSCLGSACKSVSGMVQTIRKYIPFILIPLIVIGLFFVIYFKSTLAFIIFGILFLVILSLNTIIGNLITTIICNYNASYCIFTGKGIGC